MLMKLRDLNIRYDDIEVVEYPFRRVGILTKETALKKYGTYYLVSVRNYDKKKITSVIVKKGSEREGYDD